MKTETKDGGAAGGAAAATKETGGAAVVTDTSGAGKGAAGGGADGGAAGERKSSVASNEQHGGGQNEPPPSLTPDSIKSMIAEAVKPFAESLAALSKGQQTIGDAVQKREANASRDAYVAEKLKDLPDAYRQLMPASTDAAALAAAEQQVRQKFQADMKAAGLWDKIAPPNIGGAPPAKSVADVDRVQRPGTRTANSLISEGLILARNKRGEARGDERDAK